MKKFAIKKITEKFGYKEIVFIAKNYDDAVAEYKKQFKSKGIFAIRRIEEKELLDSDTLEAGSYELKNKEKYYRVEYTYLINDSVSYVKAKSYEDAVLKYVIDKMKTPHFQIIKLMNINIIKVKKPGKKVKIIK